MIFSFKLHHQKHQVLRNVPVTSYKSSAVENEQPTKQVREALSGQTSSSPRDSTRENYEERQQLQGGKFGR